MPGQHVYLLTMSRFRHLAFLVLLALASGGCAAPSPAPTASPAGSTSAALPAVPGADSTEIINVEAGERHRFQLTAPAGFWLTLELWQRQIELELRVLDPSGRVIANAAAPGTWSVQVVDVVTEIDGRHVVEVAGAERTGGYRLRLTENRPERPDDAARVGARRELRELERRWRRGEAGPEATAERLRRLLGHPAVDWLPAERAQIALHLGDTLLASKAADDAAAAYRAGLEALPSPSAGPLAAELLRGSGRAAQIARRMEDAHRFFRQAIDVARASGDDDILGSALNNKGRLLHAQGQIDAAIEAIVEAVAAKRRGGDTDGEVTIRLNLAALLLSRGDRRAALTEHERTALLAREAGVEDSRTRFHLALQLAILYRAAGEVDDALASLAEALEVVADTGDMYGEMLTRLHLGGLLNQLGDYAEARASLLRAAELAEQNGNDNDRAAVSVQLGWAELGEGDPAAARARLAPALDTPGLRTDLQLSLLHAAGAAETAAGEREAARRHLVRAVELSEGAGLRLAAADLHRALGSLHLDAGDLAAAASALGEAAARAAEIADPLRRAASASLLARLAAARGDPVAALEQALAAIALREEVRSRIADASLRASFLARWRGDFDLAIEMLMRLSREDGREEHLRQAFRLSEAAHARTLSELLAEARVDVRRGIAPELLAAERAAERRLSLVQSELTDALVRALDGDRIAALEDERRQAQRDLQAVESDIRRRHPRYAEIHHPRPPGVEEVQAWLTDDTALLEYALGERSSVLFVVTRDDFHAFTLAGNGEIGDRVAAVRELLGGSPLAHGRLAAEIAELTRLLLAPAADHLAAVDRLLVVPDRDLFYLPFEALGDPADPAAIAGGALRRWAVTYLPSAAVLAHLAPQRPAHWERDVLLLADPPALTRLASADRRGGGSSLVPVGGLAPLPGARREAEQIAALFPGRADLFVGDAARESLLKTPGAVPPAQRLHIASHGHISEEDPAASFVLLASDGEDDGLLQIHEVFNLDLSSELVVLSGCETALGRRVEGEGLLGLARAFLYAGARELIVSLWPVSDAATAELMVDFYRHLIADRDPADALRRAKLAALDAGAPPALWAAFIVFAPPPPPARTGSR